MRSDPGYRASVDLFARNKQIQTVAARGIDVELVSTGKPRLNVEKIIDRRRRISVTLQQFGQNRNAPIEVHAAAMAYDVMADRMQARKHCSVGGSSRYARCERPFKADAFARQLVQRRTGGLSVSVTSQAAGAKRVDNDQDDVHIAIRIG